MADLRPVSEVGIDPSLAAAGRLPVDVGSATVTATGAVTIPAAITVVPNPSTTATPAVHTLAAVTIAAVSAKKNTITGIVASIAGTGTAPTSVNLGIVEDAAGTPTTVFSIDLYGFGVFNLALPAGGLQQPTANKTFTVTVADPGASNTAKLNVMSYNS